MPARTLTESLMLSVGLIACGLSAAIWANTAGWARVLEALLDARLWQAVQASAAIGTVAGLGVAATVLVLSTMYLYAGRSPSTFVIVAAMTSALTPDIVHGLIWRSLLQPGIGPRFAQDLLSDSFFQRAVLGGVLAIKWSPLAAIAAVMASERQRAQLRFMLVLAGISAAPAFWRSLGPSIARSSLVGLAFGFLVGVRQHELSDTMLAGGVGLSAEGVSQWISKVALDFLDPGRAAAELLFIIALLLSLGAPLAIVTRTKGGTT